MMATVRRLAVFGSRTILRRGTVNWFFATLFNVVLSAPGMIAMLSLVVTVVRGEAMVCSHIVCQVLIMMIAGLLAIFVGVSILVREI